MTKEQDAIEYLKESVVIYKNTIPKISKAIETVLNMLKEKDKEIEKALEIAFQYGQIDGDHHKTWVIDQMVRILTGDKYNEFVKEYETDVETGVKECFQAFDLGLVEEKITPQKANQKQLKLLRRM